MYKYKFYCKKCGHSEEFVLKEICKSANRKHKDSKCFLLPVKCGEKTVWCRPTLQSYFTKEEDFKYITSAKDTNFVSQDSKSLIINL